MSALITTALVTPCGSITNPTIGGYVDAAGNVQGSSQFLVNYVVDYAGNLGPVTVTYACDLTGGTFQYIPPTGPWEAQNVTTGETIGSDLSHIATAYATTTANPLTNFASYGCTGYMDGVISGAGPWTIQSGTQNIGGVPWAGTGLIISTADNTITGMTTLQAGSHLQLGLDVNATTGKTGSVTLNAGATLDIFGANGPAATTKVGAVTNTGGTINAKGPDICGQGYFQNAGAFTNNGTFNIDDSKWRLATSMAGTGTINVLDGGTFSNGGLTVNQNQAVNIAGCGWCRADGTKEGALYFEGVATWQAVTTVTAPACIKSNSGANTSFSGLLKGNAPLTVGTVSATKPNGTVAFMNTANTYSGTMTVDGTTLSQSTTTSLQYAKIVLENGARIGSAGSQTIGSLASTDSTTYWSIGAGFAGTIANNGITTFAGRLLASGNAFVNLMGPSTNELTMTGTGNTVNIFPKTGSRLILEGATFTSGPGQIRATGSTVSAGTSTTAACEALYLDGSSTLEVRASGAGASKMTVGTGGFVPTAGWKVDLPDAMAAGTYPILTHRGASTSSLPAVGINATGRTVSFAWNNAVVPRVLNMILS